MARYHWLGPKLVLQKSFVRLKEKWFLSRITFWSLFYNSLTSWTTVVEVLMQPLVWLVDHVVRYLGPFFVVLVIFLTTSVVLIFYVCLLPHKAAESIFWTIYHLVFGHWLLINIVFHYLKAVFTSPGYPPGEIPQVGSICKKCVAPKPPRTHHCSVCNRCVLKMDHHCPWLNNCVGHYNHRYFLLFCTYMCTGCVYVSLSALPLFRIHFYGEDNEILYDESISGLYYHQLIIYEFVLCSAVTVALFALLCWHMRLISRAETSIELHTNSTEAKRCKEKGVVFRNKYNFGVFKNWQKFLGFTDFRSFCTKVLLPSSHLPEGDGLEWEMITNNELKGVISI